MLSSTADSCQQADSVSGNGISMSDFYSTKDVEEAAFLMCQDGLEFDSAECRPKRSGGVAVFFRFTGLSDVEIGAIRKSYFNRNSLVEPKMFYRYLQDIRGILHEALQDK